VTVLDILPRAHRKSAMSNNRLWPVMTLLLAATACTWHKAPPVLREVLPLQFFARSDSVRLFYRIANGKYAGIPRQELVVINGGPGLDRGYLETDLHPLAASRLVTFYDQRGTGLSSAPPDSNAYGLDAQVADLELIRTRAGIDRMALAGHSWGALIAVAYAAAHPERVTRLVLITPPPPTRGRFWEEFRANIAARTDSTLAARQLAAFTTTTADALTKCREAIRLTMVPYFPDTATMRRMRGTWCDAPGDALGTTLRTMRLTLAAVGEWDLTPSLPQLSMPTLVIQGSEDVIPADVGKRWVAMLPQGRLLVMPHTGHYPWLDAPPQFFRAMNAFLDGHWPEDATRPQP
jgi:proline iminopeptidase